MPTLRAAETSDRESIHAVHTAAFAGDEADLVAKLACKLLDQRSTPETLHLVAEAGHDLVAHVAFSPVWFSEEGGLTGYLLAPLAVSPDHQKKGLGTRLVEAGIERLRDRGVDLLLVYGDPKYYGRFGFTPEVAAAFLPPYELEHPFGWLGRRLTDKASMERPVRFTCVAPLCDPRLW